MHTLILDLDHTLLDTTTFKAALAASLHLTPQQWDEAYNQFVTDYGMFNATDFLRGVSTADKTAFEAALHKISHFLYPDSLAFIHQAIEFGYTVVLVTFGNVAWQKQKLAHLRLPNAVTTIATDTAKISQLAEYIQSDTLVVDDNAKELEAIKQQWPAVTAYWMCRANGKYRDSIPTVPHTKITSLTDIKL